MKRGLLLAGLLALWASPAGAFTLGRPVARAWLRAHQVASCPSGVPTQTITVVDQANVRPWALAKVERALVDQSMQLRSAWGTPCVVFGDGGWRVYLKVGEGTFPHGEHDWQGQPYAFVWKGTGPDGTVADWTAMFSHEIVEMLVNPHTDLAVYHTMRDFSRLLVAVEVADPVESRAYRVDGVLVSNFVLPAWYQNGMQTVRCKDNTCDYFDPLSTATSGPWDFMRLLDGPWAQVI